MRGIGILVVAAGLVAPAARARPAPPPRATGVAGSPRSPALELAEITILYDGFPTARLHSDGRTESVGDKPPGPHAKLSPGPVLHRDGTIALTKPGFSARVSPDGAVYVTTTTSSGSREQLFGRISGDQFSVAGAKAWMVRVDGNRILYNAADWPPDELRGATTPGARRAVLVMLAAYYVEHAVAAP